jgi:hypothetical protein
MLASFKHWSPILKTRQQQNTTAKGAAFTKISALLIEIWGATYN